MRRAEQLDDLRIEDDSLYLFSNDGELRSHACADYIKNKWSHVPVLELEYVEKDLMHVVGLSEPDMPLGSQKAFSEFFLRFPHQHVYIDATGMNVRLAAALLLRISSLNKEIHVVYAEPDKYDTKQFHKRGEDHEWAGTIKGISPLPGFSNFANSDDDYVFCVFLGFEGGRFAHLLKEMQPMEELIIPVLGLPGFRIEYPYNAYWSNRKVLKDTESSANIKYTAANSIVDAYILLHRIKKDNLNHKIVVAPLGTKPHAIASIAFAMNYFKDVEIVYDNPIKMESRSEGIGLILDCNISKLLRENP